MDKTKAPTLKIGGKTIKAESPKMKVWRKFLEFYNKDEEEFREMTLAEYTDAYIGLAVLAFNNPEVTEETLEENLSVHEIKPLVAEIFRWLQTIFFLGTDKLPNADEVAATEEEG